VMSGWLVGRVVGWLDGRAEMGVEIAESIFACRVEGILAH
jgi:hypothetical protein